MFKLEIDTTNDAFSDQDWGLLARDQELAFLLRAIAEKIEAGYCVNMKGSHTVTDRNGNRCGYFILR
jgi:hypothetical protein